MSKLPPSPPLSAAQQAKQWIEKPLALLEHCYKEYGDIFTLELGALGSTVFFADPQAIEQIFKSHPYLFECHQFNVSYRDLMGNNALFLQDGAAHKRLRRIMMPPFHHERVQIYSEQIAQLAENLAEPWSKGKLIKVRRQMHELALEILMKIVFGTGEAPGQTIEEWFKDKVFSESKGWKPWFNYSKLQTKIRELIAAEIAKRETTQQEYQTDLLDWLRQSTDEQGEPLTAEELQDQILTLMITAVDPVAMSLTWALYWIHKLPQVKAKLTKEINELEGKIDPLTVSRLPYLSAVCQETLRLHPILPTVSGRRLTKEMEIGGYTFAEGITLAPCAYLVHHREELYPEPYSFNPERFLERQYGPYEYFPFGGGNRTCLGSALAPLEMKLVIAILLARHDFALLDEEIPETVRYGTLVAPDQSFQLLVTK